MSATIPRNIDRAANLYSEYHKHIYSTLELPFGVKQDEIYYNDYLDKRQSGQKGKAKRFWLADDLRRFRKIKKGEN